MRNVFEIVLRDGIGEYGLPALLLLGGMLLLIRVLRPARWVAALLGPATTPFAAGIIVFAVLLLGPALFMAAVALDIRPWIAAVLATTGAGLCATLAEADRARYLDAGRAEMTIALDQMARSLRVGMSLEQAVDQAADLGDGLVFRALQQCRHGSALGRDMPVLMHEQAAILGLPGFSALAALVSLHRITGGKLSERLAAQIVAANRRRHAQSKLRLAAMQVTLQANILVVFVGVLIAQTALMEPKNLIYLLETDPGRQMLAGSICLAGMGWLAIWGLMRISGR